MQGILQFLVVFEIYCCEAIIFIVFVIHLRKKWRR